MSSTVSWAMQGRVRDVKWNDDLGRIASLDADGTVRLWDAELELVQEVSLGPDNICLYSYVPQGASQVLTLPLMTLLASASQSTALWVPACLRFEGTDQGNLELGDLTAL